MADETPNDPAPEETPEQPAAEEPTAPEPTAPEPDAPAEQPAAEQPAADEIVDDEVVVVPSDDVPGVEVDVEATVAESGLIEVDEDEADFVDETPRVKPAIPGADLEVDIVSEGQDPLGRGSVYDENYDPEVDAEAPAEEDPDAIDDQPITATIELAADARYRATGKRKTAIARVTLKPGTGAYTVNGRTLDEFFPRDTLQRTIRQPLETVGYETRMDVVVRIHGGGVSSQAGALRHGISRALLEADPNLRGELKRRGFLTRDSRVKERKKAGLKKARKRPQFSKR
jgi:small subunit ribosomal protein S9